MNEPSRQSTTSAIDLPDSQTRISMRIRGGLTAPRRARRCVLSKLGGQLADARASEALLIVDELVANSVLHAHVGSHQTLIVELTRLRDRLRIAVIDHGSQLEPSLRPPDHETTGGFGLVLVDKLCADWGFARDGVGTTRVWCELPLDASPRREDQTAECQPVGAGP